MRSTGKAILHIQRMFDMQREKQEWTGVIGKTQKRYLKIKQKWMAVSSVERRGTWLYLHSAAPRLKQRIYSIKTGPVLVSNDCLFKCRNIWILKFLIEQLRESWKCLFFSYNNKDIMQYHLKRIYDCHPTMKLKLGWPLDFLFAKNLEGAVSHAGKYIYLLSGWESVVSGYEASQQLA